MNREDKTFEIFKILMAQQPSQSGSALAAQSVSIMNEFEKVIDFNSKPVWEVLWLSRRPSNCFRAENIYTIKDLLSKTERQLLAIPNFGRRSLNEVKAALSEMNLSLRPCEPSVMV